MALNAAVGRQIKQRRRELRISQEELAEKLDLSHQQIHKYESGATPITIERLHEFAVHLETTTGFFLRGARLEKTDKHLPDKRSIKEKQLLRLYRTIDDSHVQAALFQLIRRLSQRLGRTSGLSI